MLMIAALPLYLKQASHELQNGIHLTTSDAEIIVFSEIMPTGSTASILEAS